MKCMQPEKVLRKGSSTFPQGSRPNKVSCEIASPLGCHLGHRVKVNDNNLVVNWEDLPKGTLTPDIAAIPYKMSKVITKIKV